ncbi:L-threonylcarbamoyladenylate synthase [Aureivirga sp. CE67]|uniref:L-threonylcarbamoyladenylate synthase n=1 Tax=Aureivirga sp. CE67 TaxID=1788983 RepID=UPI0018CAA4FF|nr:L-threonylcarbamoyladenylate synthase [Aureivirga sp. CE67]
MKQEIQNTIEAIEKDKVILYPTDTIWGIGCDATCEKAVQRIYEIKNRVATKSMIILVSDVEMLKNYVEYVPEKAIEIIKNQTRPTTIIYEGAKNLAKNVVSSDGTIAIRVVDNEFCKELIRTYKKPIVSTSANLSGEPSPTSFKEISNAILDNVDYIVNLHREKISTVASKIIKISGEEIIVIRE